MNSPGAPPDVIPDFSPSNYPWLLLTTSWTFFSILTFLIVARLYTTFFITKNVRADLWITLGSFVRLSIPHSEPKLTVGAARVSCVTGHCDYFHPLWLWQAHLHPLPRPSNKSSQVQLGSKSYRHRRHGFRQGSRHCLHRPDPWSSRSKPLVSLVLSILLSGRQRGCHCSCPRPMQSH